MDSNNVIHFLFKFQQILFSIKGKEHNKLNRKKLNVQSFGGIWIATVPGTGASDIWGLKLAQILIAKHTFPMIPHDSGQPSKFRYRMMEYSRAHSLKLEHVSKGNRIKAVILL